MVKRALKEQFEITENIYEIPNSVDIEKIKELSNESIRLPRGHLFTTLGRLDNNKKSNSSIKSSESAKEIQR